MKMKYTREHGPGLLGNGLHGIFTFLFQYQYTVGLKGAQIWQKNHKNKYIYRFQHNTGILTIDRWGFDPATPVTLGSHATCVHIQICDTDPI